MSSKNFKCARSRAATKSLLISRPKYHLKSLCSFQHFCWNDNTTIFFLSHLATHNTNPLPSSTKRSSRAGHTPPQCSSHTVNRLVLLVSSGNKLVHSMTMAWGTMMVQDTSQMSMMLLRARLAVLLNIRGWQMAYQRSWAMQLRVRTETDTEMVWR